MQRKVCVVPFSLAESWKLTTTIVTFHLVSLQLSRRHLSLHNESRRGGHRTRPHLSQQRRLTARRRGHRTTRPHPSQRNQMQTPLGIRQPKLRPHLMQRKVCVAPFSLAGSLKLTTTIVTFHLVSLQLSRRHLSLHNKSRRGGHRTRPHLSQQRHQMARRRGHRTTRPHPLQKLRNVDWQHKASIQKGG